MMHQSRCEIWHAIVDNRKVKLHSSELGCDNNKSGILLVTALRGVGVKSPIWSNSYKESWLNRTESIKLIVFNLMVNTVTSQLKGSNKENLMVTITTIITLKNY